MVTSLLYVSKSTIPATQKDAAIADILTVAGTRNARLGVTGALISTSKYFAQILEGSAPAIDELMASIRRDSRHTGLSVVDIAQIPGRRFENWSMAFSGPSLYVDRHIEPLFGDASVAAKAGDGARLIHILREFTK